MNNYKDHFKKMKTNSQPIRMKGDVRPRMTISRKSSQSASLKLGCLMALALSMSMYGFLYPEQLVEMADRITFFSTSEAKESATPAETKAPKKADAAASQEQSKESKAQKPAAEVSDNVNYIQHLDERTLALDEKEKQLKELEEKLHQEKLALEKKVEELEAKRRDIASKLEGRVQQDEESVKKLVDVYSNMKPQSAAQVMATIDEELAISILKRMKKQEAGNILNFLPPQKAKALSEKYTGY